VYLGFSVGKREQEVCVSQKTNICGVYLAERQTKNFETDAKAFSCCEKNDKL
jgi:hypothetical protein